MVAAIHHETGRAHQVHPLKGGRAAGQTAERHEQVGAEDQPGAAPTCNLDQQFGGVQAATFTPAS